MLRGVPTAAPNTRSPLESFCRTATGATATPPSACAVGVPPHPIQQFRLLFGDCQRKAMEDVEAPVGAPPQPAVGAAAGAATGAASAAAPAAAGTKKRGRRVLEAERCQVTGCDAPLELPYHKVGGACMRTGGCSRGFTAVLPCLDTLDTQTAVLLQLWEHCSFPFQRSWSP